ncbi:hypothetical protein QEP66_24290 [Streptomyces sp. LB8]|uniref:DUF6643 family protein n=1 Tax=Streptomyces sp. LB8 TaxID=3042509 RepID=UPI00264A303C|nr:DUF6643 family protein [Streptomyces sp. LB8]MDN5385152.1 hypothetical protein [Streptomyces sp. LB8]
MTSPRSSYGGGYYSASSFPDTPIYDSLVAERGTPQIAPIRVPAPYDTGSHLSTGGSSQLPALPSALPALPSAPSQPSYGGYPQAPQPVPPQPAPLQSAPLQPAPLQSAPLQQVPPPGSVPQQAGMPRGYPGPQQPQQPRPAGNTIGYEAMRPAAAPRPAPAPHQDPYGNQQQYRGY